MRKPALTHSIQSEKHHSPLFVRTLLKHPFSIGAIWPSSSYLAKEMADHADTTQPILELGPGTGVVTRALLEKDLPINQLIVVECQPAFVQLLQDTFPSLRIIEGNAIHLQSLLQSEPLSIKTVVSSLPLLALPRATKEKILAQIYNLLPAGGRYIQFTYGVSGDLRPFCKHICSKRIWLNMPPARVDVYEK